MFVRDNYAVNIGKIEVAIV